MEQELDPLALSLENWLNAEEELAKIGREEVGNSWVLNFILKIELDVQTEIEAIKANAETRINQANAKLSSAMYRHGDMFNQECEAMLAMEKDRKSVVLDFGKIGHRTSQPSLEVLDPKEAFRYLSEETSALDAMAAASVDTFELMKYVPMERIASTVTGMKKTALLKKFKADGVIPEGCKIIEGGEKLFHKAGKGGK